jgi:endonuclease/exonuclease/phosphatase family metal-dependent hydrolase
VEAYTISTKNPKMKKILVLLLCLPLFLAAQKSPLNPHAVFPAKHQYSTGDTLRIMSWNVEHLVDDINDPYVNNGREDEGEVTVKKMLLLAKALEMANADVIVLQEAESANAVEALRDSFFPDLGYRYIADARSRNWYQNVVILSKLPLGRMTAYGDVHTPVVFEEDGEKKYQTQNYINSRMWTCELIINQNYALFLSGAHLKAGGGDRNRAMRLAQIDYLKYELERLLAAEPKSNLIILGDLNSFRDGPEVERLLNDDRKQLAFIDPLPADINTHPSDGPNRRLDYILYNKNLKDEVICNSAQVFKPFSPEEMRIISDHLPVILDLKTTDQ